MISPYPPGILPDPDDVESGSINCIATKCTNDVQVELVPDNVSDIVPTGYNENFDTADNSDKVSGICTLLTEECTK